jgi:threonyl-tRNA synthetase
MRIHLQDGTEVELEEAASGKELVQKLNLRGPAEGLALRVNGELRDLSQPLRDGDSVHVLHFDEPEGKELFWHSSAHILAQAVVRLWPEAKPTIGPAIENGFYYDFADLTLSEKDLPLIEKEVKKIVSENHKPERLQFASRDEALAAFPDNPYKRELIEAVPEDQCLTAYRQGDFFDLCRGPHLPNLGKVKAFKVMKTAGAYWRGDNAREMLTRIYGISFPDRAQLKDYLQRLEEAKKRDHKVIGPKLGLFSLREEAAGMPFIHPKGNIVWNHLVEFMRALHRDRGYVEIKTPVMMSKELWIRSGHWENYRENMFTSEIEERAFAIKPMNCPGGMLFYKQGVHSYRELPYRVAEFGNVHRYEASGALSGLFRVRSFHQDDAHIFMKPSDIEDEILATIQLADVIYSTFGLEYHLELSTRPESKTIGSDEDWEIATKGLKGALDRTGREYIINEGDGAFYGPKIDFHIKDALGRTWQCGTIQLDMSLPERFDLEYVDSNGERKRPIMIHRALFGSIERFFGILIEHFAGRFPLWISPLQIRILTVADRHAPYAQGLAQRFHAAGFEVDVDESSESVSKKVRNAQLQQINYILTVGDAEIENGTAGLRTRDNVVHGEVELDAFQQELEAEVRSKALRSPYSKGD